MSFSIKQHDTSPSYTATLGVNLTGATVKFIMRLPGSSSTKVSESATITGATAGQVQYAWASGDTDTAGLYAAEWEVTFAGGVKQTYPGEDYYYVNVVPDLG